MSTTRERDHRIAAILKDVMKDVTAATPATPINLQLLARGIALLAQSARLSPAAFDCYNGRDALAAIAFATPLRELIAIAQSNAFVLEARWGRVILAADLERPSDRKPAPRSSWPPKLFDWIPS